MQRADIIASPATAAQSVSPVRSPPPPLAFSPSTPPQILTALPCHAMPLSLSLQSGTDPVADPHRIASHHQLAPPRYPLGARR